MNIKVILPFVAMFAIFILIPDANAISIKSDYGDSHEIFGNFTWNEETSDIEGRQNRLADFADRFEAGVFWYLLFKAWHKKVDWLDDYQAPEKDHPTAALWWIGSRHHSGGFDWSNRDFDFGGWETDPDSPNSAAPVPEPATLLLLTSGLAGLGVGAYRRRRRP